MKIISKKKLQKLQKLEEENKNLKEKLIVVIELNDIYKKDNKELQKTLRKSEENRANLLEDFFEAINFASEVRDKLVKDINIEDLYET